MNFPFGTNGKFIILGVPILKHIRVVMQKLKFMQEFTFTIIVECLHSNVLAKFLMHNYAHAKHAKSRICSLKGFHSIIQVEIVHMTHLFDSNLYI